MVKEQKGNNDVLLVVDVQAGVVKDAWDADRIIGNLKLAVERARAANVPVVWVQHSDENFEFGAPEWQFATGLKPADGELLIHKNFNSSFEATTLGEELEKLGAGHIVLGGAQTNWCIRATAYGALERGYDLTLLKDGHTTCSIDLGNGESIEASEMIKELNIAMKWLSYPGRKNAIAAVEEIVFSNAG